MLFSPNKRLLLVQEQKTVTKKSLFLEAPWDHFKTSLNEFHSRNQLKLSNQIENEAPHPQVFFALGLLTTNIEPSNPSTKSISEPAIY
jgi:hypothetical protein